MSMIHDIIKIRFSKLGYLPNIPYHLISDVEMCDAFIKSNLNDDESIYFYDYYPCVSSSLQVAYQELVDAILYHISVFKSDTSGNAVLPDWIYSYMLGDVIGPYSDILDIHDLIYPLGVDNTDDIFNDAAATACYNTSKQWLMKLKHTKIELDGGKCIDIRPPTIFGEPHVIKYVRLSTVRLGQ